jgi:hypothetical protein
MAKWDLAHAVNDCVVREGVFGEFLEGPIAEAFCYELIFQLHYDPHRQDASSKDRGEAVLPNCKAKTARRAAISIYA